MDLSVMHALSYGLYIVGASDEGRPVGCIINTAVQITSKPATVAISLNKDNYTFSIVERMKKFSLSILSEETPQLAIATFGYSSSKTSDKFEDFSFRWDRTTPLIDAACCGHLICECISQADMGTHVVLFARVLDAVKTSDLPPMTYSYYHRVRKGKAPKNAPTYQESAETPPPVYVPTKRWVCKVCGYVHEGDMPDDFACPICHAPRTQFIPQN